MHREKQRRRLLRVHRPVACTVLPESLQATLGGGFRVRAGGVAGLLVGLAPLLERAEGPCVAPLSTAAQVAAICRGGHLQGTFV
jgi:hypothetical protein